MAHQQPGAVSRKVFISLVKDVPMIMSEIANVFKKNQAAVLPAFRVRVSSARRMPTFSNEGEYHTSPDRSVGNALSGASHCHVVCGGTSAASLTDLQNDESGAKHIYFVRSIRTAFATEVTAEA